MADELEKTCKNCKYEFESYKGEHCRHCIYDAVECFEPKIIVLTEAEIRAKAIDEFAEAIRDIHYKYPIGTDADTNEPLYGHEDGTWHNLIDDVTEQMKGE